MERVVKYFFYQLIANKECPNISTTPLRQCLPFSWTTLRGKHCGHPIAIMGFVDTFGHCNLGDFHEFFKQLNTNQITQPLSFQNKMKGQIGNFITNVTLFFSPTTSCLTFFGIIYHHVLN